MNYEILAKKWRPNCFSEIIGQKNILDAIENSFKLNRIHQSWIFSGMRGIGKTTIARLLSKSLNCLSGIKKYPCQKCSNCIDIKKGCFPDLIEIDAASKTKIENIKEILETVKYAPTKGRFKIYLIDEFHMLSKYSFNALLKVLEEPPKYIKFILVTTEINKIPKTIISRCLFFNLYKPNVKEIKKYLNKILKKEKINFEDKAIEIISKECKGSIRDSLNIIEQAILIGNNNINLSIIEKMFGLCKKEKILEMIVAILEKKNTKVISILKKMYKNNNNIEKIFTKMLKILYKIAIFKKYPILYKKKKKSLQELTMWNISENINYGDLKKYYRIVLLGKKELFLAPNKNIGIEMTILNLMDIELKNKFKMHS